MEQVIITWGYWAIALGCFLEGETVLVLGGMLAHKGYLKLEWVVLAALLGSLAGDQLWFLIGRFAGERLLGRLHRLQTASDRLARWTNHHGGWFVFGFRFLYGIRSVAPVFLGVSRFPLARFVALNALGAITWSVVVGALGWFVGLSVERILGRAARVEEAVIGVVAVAGSLWLVRRAKLRARRLEGNGNASR